MRLKVWELLVIWVIGLCISIAISLGVIYLGARIVKAVFQ